MLRVCGLVAAVLLRVASPGKFAITSASNPNCSCSRVDGGVINLEVLQKTDGPRFTTTKNDYNYSYNPCIPFTLGPAGPAGSRCQHDVALCRSYAPTFSYTTIGTQASAKCVIGSDGQAMMLYHHAPPHRTSMISIVRLECNTSKKTIKSAEFAVIDVRDWTFKLTHSACCWTKPETTTATPPDEKVGVVAGVATCSVFIFLGLGALIGRRIRQNRREREDERRRLLAEREAAQNADAAQNPGDRQGAAINVLRSCSRNSDIICTKKKFNNSPDCDVNKSPVSMA